MAHRRISHIILGIFLGIACLGTFAYHPHTARADGGGEYTWTTADSENYLNGIVRNDAGVANSNQPEATGTTNYFRQLFIFMMGLTGVSAFVMIVIGGIQYTTSGGNPANITAAKSKIWNALGGLVLAASSVLILRLINPDLVQFNIPQPPPEQAQQQTQQRQSPFPAGGSTSGGAGATGGGTTQSLPGGGIQEGTRPPLVQ